MNWNTLNTTEELNKIDELSAAQPVLLFKHSTRCSISSTALNRIERKWKDTDSQRLVPYYLDLIAYRDVSNAIAARYGVEHQSPQVIVVVNGKAVYSATHFDIVYDDLLNAINV